MSGPTYNYSQTKNEYIFNIKYPLLMGNLPFDWGWNKSRAQNVQRRSSVSPAPRASAIRAAAQGIEDQAVERRWRTWTGHSTGQDIVGKNLEIV